MTNEERLAIALDAATQMAQDAANGDRIWAIRTLIGHYEWGRVEARRRKLIIEDTGHECQTSACCQSQVGGR